MLHPFTKFEVRRPSSSADMTHSCSQHSEPALGMGELGPCQELRSTVMSHRPTIYSVGGGDLGTMYPHFGNGGPGIGRHKRRSA